MKVPESIYIQPDAQDGWFMVNNPNNTLVKYTHTDVFIEKAEEFIYSALNDGIMGTANIEDFMRLFKKYMKGE